MADTDIQDQNITNYARGSFKRTWIEDEAMYYAAFHPEFIDDDGLDETGRYFVVMLHPRGMFKFNLVLRDDSWVLDDEVDLENADNLIDDILDNENSEKSFHVRNHDVKTMVSEERLQWVSDCICKRYM